MDWSASTIGLLFSGLLAAVLQIQQFAAFVIGDKCDAIDDLLQQLDPGAFPDGDATCFDVVATLSPGFGLLLAAALIADLAGYYIISIASVAVHEQLCEANPALATLNGPAAKGGRSDVEGLPYGCNALLLPA